MEFSKQGIPVLGVREKIDALKHCVLQGSHEDAVGHLFDLLAFERSSLREMFKEDGVENPLSTNPWGPKAVVELQQLYGKHPTPIVNK